MTKININKQQQYSRQCVFCDIYICVNFFDIEIEDGGRSIYKNLCPKCHCALTKYFTGVD